MKKFIMLLIGVFNSGFAISQSPNYYFRGSAYSNFEWDLSSRKKLPKNVPNPLYSQNSIKICYGRKIQSKMFIEIGFTAKNEKDQVEIARFTRTRNLYNSAFLIGYSDTTVLGIKYFIGPSISFIWGNGWGIYNGMNYQYFTQGMSYGIEGSLNKKIIKNFGIQPALNLQYQDFKHFDQDVEIGGEWSKKFLKLYPSINLTYNF